MRTALLEGQTLGQYELRELLGQGGMGTVYRGYQVSLKREVAVKILPQDLATMPGYHERFNREAEIAAALEHPNIVPILDYATQDGVSYVVMRLLTGGTLAQRLQQQIRQGGQPPSLGEVSRLLNQLASALDYAHSKNVIHRDIKPNNVMFDNHGHPYLVDFGIAKLLEGTAQLTGTGMTMGTPAYMPPEQWKSEKVTPAADQYALGAMIYEMVTGRVPFVADTPFALMHKHINEQPTPPQAWRGDVPDAVNLVLERAMAKEAADRFPSMTALAQAFERAIQGHVGDSTHFFTGNFVEQHSTRPRNTKPTLLPDTNTFLTPNNAEKMAPKERFPQKWIVAALAIVILGLLGFIAFGQFSDEEEPAQATENAVIPTLTIGVSPSVISMLASPSQIAMNSEPTLADGVLVAQETQPAPAPSIPNTEAPTPMPTENTTQSPPQSTNNEEIPSPLELAQTPVTLNTEWIPYVETFEGVEMVLVPVGEFMMGSSEEDINFAVDLCNQAASEGIICEANWLGDESGPYPQTVTEPFWLDKTEASRAMYQECVDAGKCDPLVESEFSTAPNQPANLLTWTQARAYCEWRGGRLPTEMEWEYAARGPENWIFPWGNEVNGELANHCDSNCAKSSWSSNILFIDKEDDDGYAETAPVDSYPDGASWVGALNMSGNVWEWTSSAYQSYPYSATDGRETFDTVNLRTLRGGEFFASMFALRGSFRYWFNTEDVYVNFGVRCVRDVNP